MLSPGACKRGRRRWFHNCMVSPITEAWRADPALGLESGLVSTSKAAAVELSTPPLIATHSKNLLTIALEEIAAGKIRYEREE